MQVSNNLRDIRFPPACTGLARGGGREAEGPEAWSLQHLKTRHYSKTLSAPTVDGQGAVVGEEREAQERTGTRRNLPAD